MTSSLGWRSLVIGLFLVGGSLSLNSCGKEPIREAMTTTGDVAKPSSSISPMEGLTGYTEGSNRRDTKKASGGGKLADAQANSTTPISQKPQLARTADLSLRLESIDRMMIRLRQVVKGKQGDIYDFQDEQPQESGGHRQATLTLKVPSTALDLTLAEIIKLGRVQSQNIKSEDVTQQLVDTDARLKNLRQQEDLTRKIMERSGSIKDILAVSKELSGIREQIEQLDATVKNLRQQVAYSTINLKVEETQSATPTSENFGVQVGETWKNSTHAAGSLATNLALGLLWLLPFTPFIAIGSGGVYYAIRKRRQRRVLANLTIIEET